MAKGRQNRVQILFHGQLLKELLETQPDTPGSPMTQRDIWALIGKLVGFDLHAPTSV